MHFTIGDYLLDITENSLHANSAEITVSVIESEALIECEVLDNGKGMDSETLKKAQDSFYTEEGKHDGRKFGFGLPFLIQAVTESGGEFDIQSKKGVGTSVKFSIDKSNIDAPPLGDIVGTIRAIISYEGKSEIVFKREVNGNGYQISKKEMIDALGDLTTVSSLSLAKQYIKSQEDDLRKI